MLKTNNVKIDTFKLYYWHGATLVGKYRLPQLEPTQFIPHDVIGFNERNSVSNPENHWIDFFVDDYNFENFWRHPEVSFNNLRRFAGIITTDYSMLPEMLPGQIIWNCTRNRVMAYYLQINGFHIVPVASWMGEDEFDMDRVPVFDIDYGMHQGQKSLHVHFYTNGKRASGNAVVRLKEGDLLYEKYKNIFKGVKL